jgi:hypothetical protein
MSRRRRPQPVKRLTLQTVAAMLDKTYGTDDSVVATAELEERSPAWRRGVRALRRLSRACLHPDYELVLTETRAAREVWPRLAALPYPEQLAAVESEEPYQSWCLCRQLQLRSGALAASDAAAAARLAVLALRITDHLEEERYDRDLVPDLQALSWCYLGNAWREAGEVNAAGDAMDLAESHRRRGGGYLDVAAEALALEALVRRDRRRLGEALALLDRVEEIYGTAREEAPSEPDLYDRERHAEARVNRAWCLYHAYPGGESDMLTSMRLAAAATAPLLDAATGLLDERRQPRLLLAARAGLAWCALTVGSPQAEAQLALALQLADRVGDEPDRLRLRRAEARFDLAQGERATAEHTLRSAANRFLELDLGIDAALACFDLAGLYLQQGAAEPLKKLGMDILPVFCSREVHRELMANFLLFQHAVEEQRLTAELLFQLAALTERERRPSLAWWGGAATLPGGGGRAGAAAG